MTPLELDRIARRQHGVIARRQTRLSSEAWKRAISAGTLVEMHRGVARLAGTADTCEQRIAAAVLAAGRGAMASHRSAALLFGVPMSVSTPVDIVVPARHADAAHHAPGRISDPLTGVIIHRPHDPYRTTPRRVRGIPCTDVPQTLVDLGDIDAAAVPGAVGHALATDLVSPTAIERTVAAHASAGGPGVTALRAALHGWAVDTRPPDSVLEPAMRRLVSRYGLPPVDFRVRVGGRDVDFQVTGTPIVIQCDGWRHGARHDDRVEHDRHESSEFTESTQSTEVTKSTEFAKSTQFAKSAQSTEFTEFAKSTEFTESTEVTEVTESTEFAKSTEFTESTEVTESTEFSEFADRGWIVLRFTYRRITTRPSEVANRIRQAIERWTAHAAA